MQDFFFICHNLERLIKITSWQGLSFLIEALDFFCMLEDLEAFAQGFPLPGSEELADTDALERS